MTATTGRPRSEQARQAVLEAVDDLLVEIGYAAMTMKNIAERAGVGRPTVYRWWSGKAAILVEACTQDAAEELSTQAGENPLDDLAGYLSRLAHFLTVEPPGRAYRALIGEAQHDPKVADLVREADLLAPPTVTVLDRVRPAASRMPADAVAVAQLAGPLLTHVLTTGAPMADEDLRRHAEILLEGWK